MIASDCCIEHCVYSPQHFFSSIHVSAIAEHCVYSPQHFSSMWLLSHVIVSDCCTNIEHCVCSFLSTRDCWDICQNYANTYKTLRMARNVKVQTNRDHEWTSAFKLQHVHEPKKRTQRRKNNNTTNENTKQTQTKQNETKQTNTIKNGTIVVNIGADTVRCSTRSATNTEQEIARMEKTKVVMNNNR